RHPLPPSLHDALPISVGPLGPEVEVRPLARAVQHDQVLAIHAYVVPGDVEERLHDARGLAEADGEEDDFPVRRRIAAGVERLDRSEEHTSELQSRSDL